MQKCSEIKRIQKCTNKLTECCFLLLARGGLKELDKLFNSRGYVELECNSNGRSLPVYNSTRESQYGLNTMRGESVPRGLGFRSRSGSVPPHAISLPKPITVESLAVQSSGLSLGPVPVTNTYRRASIAVPNGTSICYRAASSPIGGSTYRSPPPIHTYHPDRGLTLLTTERRVYKPPVAPSAPPRPPSSSRPSAAYYRVRPLHPDEPDDLGSAPVRRSNSVSRKVVTREEFVDNGHRKPKVTNEFDASQIFLPNSSIHDLRQRTKVAKDHLDKHRVLLDRYLPISMDKPEDVEVEVENKYGELVERMPQLEYRHRSSRIEEPEPYSSIEPYRPAPRSIKLDLEPLPALPPVRNSFTPKVSDVRKRARRVLCSIKGDPRYFDFS